MTEEQLKSLVNKYEQNLANTQERHIKAIELGFVENSCNTALFSMLIHCIQNIYIFNDTQLNNINSLIDNVNYG